MAKKFVIEFMVGIMVFFILIFIEVQANDLTSVSSHHSSSPIWHHHPLELDTLYKSFSICIRNEVAECQEIELKHPRGHLICVFLGFTHCIRMMKPEDPMFTKATVGYRSCMERHERNIYDLGRCFDEWLGLHVKLN